MRVKNLNKKNKYGLLEYELDGIDNRLWKGKEFDCLRYIEIKGDKSIISIRPDQKNNFKKLLDNYKIEYDEDEIVYNNISNNTLQIFPNISITPYEFQLEDANKIISKKRCLIGHEMGCLKTLISILVGESLDIPKLVICPESLRLNWKKEILSINPNADVQILYSNEDFHQSNNWTIVGYSSLNKFINKLDIKCLFIDECHYIKSVGVGGKPKSSRAKAVMELADRVDYCYLISGTPMPSKNMDIYNILKALKIDIQYFQFGIKYCAGKRNNFGWDFSGSSNTDELHELIKENMVRRLRRDVLPDLKKERIFIPFSPKLTKEYLDIERRLVEPEEKDTYMGLAMTGRRLLSLQKVQNCIDLVELYTEPIVIVTEFEETLNKLAEYYKDECCIIKGGMTDKDKNKAIEDFQSGNKRICILNMIAGGVGITLTKASIMIMLDYDWIPANCQQAEDRICRVGQTEFCKIYYIYYENSIFDNVFINMISNKSENIDKIIDNSINTMDLSNAKAVYLDMLKQYISTKN